MDVKSRLVGFLKEAKNRMSGWSFRRNAIACEFPHRCRLIKKSVRPIPAENKRTQLCLQTELAEEKSQSLHSQKLLRWAQQIYVTKEKNRYSECYKIVLYAGSKYFDKPEKPGPTYNSAPCQKFHSKSPTCITTQKYIWNLNQNAQRWIGKKVPSLTFNTKRMSNKTRCDVSVKL